MRWLSDENISPSVVKSVLAQNIDFAPGLVVVASEKRIRISKAPAL